MSRAYNLLKKASYKKTGPIALEEASTWLQILQYNFERSNDINNKVKLSVGVSGGADSMLLAYLMKMVLEKNVTGLVVDHNLREGSQKEALVTIERLNKLGINSELIKLNWNNNSQSSKNTSTLTPYLETSGSNHIYHALLDQPQGSKLETLARKTRYESLALVMSLQKQDTLAVGHHLNDQIETSLFRLTRESGITGLAGISPLRSFPIKLDRTGLRSEMKVFRPLLMVTKERIYESCKYYGLEWVEDPTNLSTKVQQRNVIRNLLKTIENSDDKKLEPLKLKSLQMWVDHMINHSEVAKAQVNKILYTAFTKPQYGLLQFKLPEKLTSAHWLNNPFLASRFFSRATQWVCNSDYPPRLSHVIAAYKSILSKDGRNYYVRAAHFCVQIGGALIISSTKKNPYWTIIRDPLSLSQVKELTYKLPLFKESIIDEGEGKETKLVSVPNKDPFITTWYHRFNFNIKALKSYSADPILLNWASCFLPTITHLPQTPQHTEIIIRPIHQLLLTDLKTKYNVFEPSLDSTLSANVLNTLKEAHYFQKAITVTSARNTIPVICLRIYTQDVKTFSSLPQSQSELTAEFVDVPLVFPTFKNANIVPHLLDVKCEFLFPSLIEKE